MGAWGTKNFENDDALDWIAGLEEDFDIELIKDAFGIVINSDGEYLEAPDCNNALAAAEIVAGLREYPCADLPDEVSKMIREHKQVVSPDLITMAVKVIKRIKVNSELKELWDESDSVAEWYQVIDDLETRLTR